MKKLCVVILAGLALAGCQTYEYHSPNGGYVVIKKPMFTDTKFGRLTATASDGSHIEIENYSNEDRLAQALVELAKAAPK